MVGAGDEKRWFHSKPYFHHLEYKYKIWIIEEDGDADSIPARYIKWIKKHPDQIPMPLPTLKRLR